MIVRYLLLCWILAIAANISSSGHLEAAALHDEVVRGNNVVVDAYLFNDAAADITTVLSIQGPNGFELVEAPKTMLTTVPPGGVLHSTFTYLVLPSAAKGLDTFIVTAFRDINMEQATQQTTVVVRVGPIEWPPPLHKRYLPIAKR